MKRMMRRCKRLHPDLKNQVQGDKLELWMHVGVELSSINRQKTNLTSPVKRQVRSLTGEIIHSLRVKRESVTSEPRKNRTKISQDKRRTET